MKRLYVILCLMLSLLIFPGCGQKTAPVSTTTPQQATTTQPAADTSKSQAVTPTSSTQQQSTSSSTVQPSTKAPETVKPVPAQEKKQTVTVYVTKTGAKYHTYGCQYLSKSCIAIELDKAKAQGYTPCSKCGPPR